jgi:hypothetical protein
MWCKMCVLSLEPSTELTRYLPCGYVIPCWTIVGVAQGLIGSICGIETNWLDDIWSMWGNCSTY